MNRSCSQEMMNKVNRMGTGHGEEKIERRSGVSSVSNKHEPMGKTVLEKDEAPICDGCCGRPNVESSRMREGRSTDAGFFFFFEGGVRERHEVAEEQESTGTVVDLLNFSGGEHLRDIAIVGLYGTRRLQTGPVRRIGFRTERRPKGRTPTITKPSRLWKARTRVFTRKTSSCVVQQPLAWREANSVTHHRNQRRLSNINNAGQL